MQEAFTVAFSLTFGIFMGLSIAAPPGPVNAMIANESLKSKLHGTSVGAGAMTADGIFFFLTVAFGHFLPQGLLKYFYVVGGILMIYLAYLTIKSGSSNRSRRGNYFVGLTMGLTNPFQISWWLTVGLFMITRISIFSVLGFFIGISMWIISFPYAVNRVGVRFTEYIKIFSVTVLLFFALFMFYNVIF